MAFVRLSIKNRIDSLEDSLIVGVCEMSTRSFAKGHSHAHDEALRIVALLAA